MSVGESERFGGAAFVVRLPGPKTAAVMAAKDGRDRKGLSQTNSGETSAPPVSAR